MASSRCTDPSALTISWAHRIDREYGQITRAMLLGDFEIVLLVNLVNSHRSTFGGLCLSSAACTTSHDAGRDGDSARWGSGPGVPGGCCGALPAAAGGALGRRRRDENDRRPDCGATARWSANHRQVRPPGRPPSRRGLSAARPASHTRLHACYHTPFNSNLTYVPHQTLVAR